MIAIIMERFGVDEQRVLVYFLLYVKLNLF